MTSRPEPHRDQRTIGSFKRTCNAALLLWVANRSSRPPTQGRVRPVRVASLLVGALLLARGVDTASLAVLP